MNIHCLPTMQYYMHDVCLGLYVAIVQRVTILFTLLAVLVDLCHNQGLATTEEGEEIVQYKYTWANCVVRLQCAKERETAERTIELLEEYKKIEEATVLKG